MTEQRLCGMSKAIHRFENPSKGKEKAGWIKKTRATSEFERCRDATLLPLSDVKRKGFTIGSIPNVHAYIVKGNQYVIGGTAACASISFEAAFYMTNIESIKDAIDNVQWEEKVLVRGKQLWTAWKHLTRRMDTYQSIDDIIKIPNITPLLDYMGKRTEYYGPLLPMDKRKYNEGIEKLVTKEMTYEQIAKTVFVQLPYALQQMFKTSGTHTTALLFSNGATLSLYAYKNGEILIYDSHGTMVGNGLSAIFRCANVDVATNMLRRILTSFGMESSYNICIFESCTSVLL